MNCDKVLEVKKYVINNAQTPQMTALLTPSLPPAFFIPCFAHLSCLQSVSPELWCCAPQDNITATLGCTWETRRHWCCLPQAFRKQIHPYNLSKTYEDLGYDLPQVERTSLQLRMQDATEIIVSMLNHNPSPYLTHPPKDMYCLTPYHRLHLLCSVQVE